MAKLTLLTSRWLGVGLAAVLSVLTLVLTATGRLHLYISPTSAWFAASMAVIAVVFTVASFALPLGTEADHGHDHGADAHTAHEHPRPNAVGRGLTAIGGVIASVIAIGALVLPPASLSSEIAMSRDLGSPPLFGGDDTVQLATKGDVSSFGIGQWATVFATAPNPAAFEGTPITLSGFVTPADDAGQLHLTRLVITHCVIDAQPATLPVDAVAFSSDFATGDWLTISGQVRVADDGGLVIDPDSIEQIDEPEDPYEY